MRNDVIFRQILAELDNERSDVTADIGHDTNINAGGIRDGRKYLLDGLAGRLVCRGSIEIERTRDPAQVLRELAGQIRIVHMRVYGHGHALNRSHVDAARADELRRLRAHMPDIRPIRKIAFIDSFQEISGSGIIFREISKVGRRPSADPGAYPQIVICRLETNPADIRILSQIPLGIEMLPPANSGYFSLIDSVDHSRTPFLIMRPSLMP